MVVKISANEVRLDEAAIFASGSTLVSYADAAMPMEPGQKYSTRERHSIKTTQNTITGMASDESLTIVNTVVNTALETSGRTSSNVAAFGNLAVVTTDLSLALETPGVVTLVTESRAEKMRAESMGKVAVEVNNNSETTALVCAALNVRRARYYSAYQIPGEMKGGSASYIDRSADGYDGLAIRVNGFVSQFIEIEDDDVYIDVFSGPSTGTTSTRYIYYSNYSDGNSVPASGSLTRVKKEMTAGAGTNQLMGVKFSGTNIEPLGIEMRPRRRISGTRGRHIYAIGTSNVDVTSTPSIINLFGVLKSRRGVTTSGSFAVLGFQRTFMIKCGLGARRSDFVRFDLLDGNSNGITPQYVSRSINKETGTNTSSSSAVGTWVFNGSVSDRVEVRITNISAWTSLTPVQVRGDISYFSAYEI